MAYLGCGFYKKKIPLRAIGVFPTWDRLIFAVRKDSGIESLEDVKRKQYPLRISTRRRGKLQTTVYAIEEVLKSYGMSFKQIEAWGGKVMEAPSPSSKERKDHIQSGKADAVFDEGVKSWGNTALDAGMRFLPIDDAAARHMSKLGFPSAMLTRKHYPKLDRDLRCVDFSGWTFFCHADLPAEIAYGMAKAVDLCHKQIPVDHFNKRPMTMREFSRGGEAGQLNIPLASGREEIFSRKGLHLGRCHELCAVLRLLLLRGKDRKLEFRATNKRSLAKGMFPMMYRFLALLVISPLLGELEIQAQTVESKLAALEKLSASERQQRLFEAAKGEGEAIIYANMDVSAMKPLTDGFMKRYPGMKAASVHFSGAAIITRIETEARAGNRSPTSF